MTLWRGMWARAQRRLRARRVQVGVACQQTRAGSTARPYSVPCTLTYFLETLTPYSTGSRLTLFLIFSLPLARSAKHIQLPCRPGPGCWRGPSRSPIHTRHDHITATRSSLYRYRVRKYGTRKKQERSLIPTLCAHYRTIHGKSKCVCINQSTMYVPDSKRATAVVSASR